MSFLPISRNFAVITAVLSLPAGYSLASEKQSTPPPAPVAWQPDLGDGTYKNPVLYADYSDPDAVRVGDDYYLTSSTFTNVPGLPILHSKDLVNWKIVSYALSKLVPAAHFSTPRHGEGVWAPALRHHAGKFWIFYPDPDFGIYVITATNPAGPWSEPLLLKAGKGLIDPCPLWDDDGQAYFVHGWAKSRAGINNLLTLHRISADCTQVLDEGKIIIDANKIPGWGTLEGPKLYKREGWYYVFAPAGGVKEGWQAVFRSKDIWGPYEHRITLEQGSTKINGPHQGAWVDTPSGEHWFLHFQDREAYGRIVHLQPIVWKDGWPVMGNDPEGDGKGEPVLTHKKPAVPPQTPAAPEVSDEFTSGRPGLPWQWQANPKAEWLAASPQPEVLRLPCVPTPENFYQAANLLTQKPPAPEFSATTELSFFAQREGEQAGLLVFGYSYAWIGLKKTAAGQRLVQVTRHEANKKGQDKEIAGVDFAGSKIFLRVTVRGDFVCSFSYSEDGRTFTPFGDSFKAEVGRWVGAKLAIFATAPESTATAGKVTGHADYAWFRITPPLP
jgi:beta-xylosidase